MSRTASQRVRSEPSPTVDVPRPTDGPLGSSRPSQGARGPLQRLRSVLVTAIGRVTPRGLIPIHRLGRDGERLAERHLKGQGYRILSRNRRLSGGEVDLIAESPDGAIVFVEVKARRSDRWRAELAIHPRKRRRMIHLAQRLARRHGWTNRRLRIDVIAIVWPEGEEPVIRHHRSAVTLDG